MVDSVNLDGKLFISTTAQTVDLLEAGFEALTWTAIEAIVTMPSVGVTENILTQDYINTTIASKRKGIRAGNDTEVVVGYDSQAVGQDALRAASSTRMPYAFKREYSDANSAALTNTIKYFRALITRPSDSGGGAEDFVNDTYGIAIVQVPVIVKPEAI